RGLINWSMRGRGLLSIVEEEVAVEKGDGRPGRLVSPWGIYQAFGSLGSPHGSDSPDSRACSCISSRLVWSLSKRCAFGIPSTRISPYQKHVRCCALCISLTGLSHALSRSMSSISRRHDSR
ncbi:hypothetical protein CLAIMM_01409, partial [Cladophialophora immunda]